MTIKNLTVFLISLFLILVTARVYLHEGVPYTHDGENHLARFANYRAAIREGQFPPRFAPNLENGYGYPVFNYNYPLANILSVPLSLAGFSYETTFKLLVIAFLTLGVTGLWKFLGLYALSNTSRFVAVLTWASAPFLISAIVFRGSIGELLVYGLLPMLLLQLSLVARGRKIRIWDFVLWIAFFLAHTISVVWVMPILAAFFILEWWYLGKDKERLIQCLYALMFSGLASLWFWLPALAEMPAIVLGGAQNTLTYAQHFPTLHQLFSSPLQFGYSNPGSVDGMSFALGFLSWSTIFVFPVWYISSGYKFLQIKHQRYLLVTAWVCVVVLIFLQLHSSNRVWQLLPFLRFLQFPWRLSLILPLLSALMLGSMITTASVTFQRLTALFVICYWLLMSGVLPLEYIHNPDIRYDTFVLSTSTQNENRARTFLYSDIGNNPRQPFIIEGAGVISSTIWNGSYRTYHVSTTEQSIVVEPTMNFPGWETHVNGKILSYIDSQKIGGRIAYSVPVGSHQITTQFTQRTPARRVGNAVSLVAVVWIIVREATMRRKV